MILIVIEFIKRDTKGFQRISTIRRVATMEKQCEDTLNMDYTYSADFHYIIVDSIHE